MRRVKIALRVRFKKKRRLTSNQTAVHYIHFPMYLSAADSTLMQNTISCVNVFSEGLPSLNDTSIDYVVQKEYMIMIFKDLDGNLIDNLSALQYSEIFDSISGSDNKYKIAALLALDEYSEQRMKLNEYLSNYPVLRSRIAQISNLCRQKNNVLNEIERFTRRITWHIIRLYRTRNAIIHSGDIPDNLKALGEHLHSYIDACIWQIMVSLTSDRFLSTIENVLIDEMFQVERIMKDLSSKEKFKADDVFLCCNTIKYSRSSSSEQVRLESDNTVVHE